MPPPGRRAATGGVTVAALLLAALLVGACAGRGPGDPAPGVGSTTLDWAGLRLEYRMLPSPGDRIRVSATVVNGTGRRVYRELPYCVIRMRLYRADRVVWDQARDEACVGVRTLELAPGEQRDYRSSVTAERILGDSLAPGDYLVRLYLPGSDRPGTFRTSVELTLAAKTLERAP